MSIKATLASLLLLAAGQLPAAEKDGWVETAGEATAWEKSLPVWNMRRAVLVLDSPALTRLRGMILPNPLPKVEMAWEKRAADLLGNFKPENESGLVIEWLGADPVQDFARAWQQGGGQVRSVCRAGSTTITRTVLASAADDALFIHLLADQPGALSFRVSIPAAGVRSEDRRQLLATPDTGPASHVWVIPFESDVEPDGRSVTVRGEGEALIVWNFSPGKATAAELAGIWARLAVRHDPDHTPPDVSKVWHGLLETHMKSVENSP